MRPLSLIAVALLALGVAPPDAGVSAGPGLVVAGASLTPGTLTQAQLRAIGSVSARWTSHGKTHAVQGTPVEALLKSRGWTPGPMGPEVPKVDKRSGYKKVLIATARDGYQAVFSVAELTPGMGATRALIIWTLDGVALPAESGPLQLVVLTDGEPSRSLYALERLDLVDPRPPPR